MKSAAANKLSIVEEGKQQLDLVYREDRVNEFWDSRLFNRVYLKHDIQDKIAAWNDDQYFAEFQDKIKNILNAYKSKEQALESMSERNLQNTIVKDILSALNWAKDEDGPIKPFIDDVSLTYKEKTYKPDIIVLDHPDDNQKVESSKAQERLNYARQCAKMVIEVKYWNRIEKQFQREKEDKALVNKDRQDDLSGIVSPNDQTIRYMDLLKLNWGILTDGTKWRLFNKDLSVEGSDRYYEFNFYMLFKAYNTAKTKADHDAVDAGLRYFFHFFSRYSFFPEDGSEPLVDTVLKESKKYADKIEEDLKKRFLEAMNVACNAFHDAVEFEKIVKDQKLDQESANSLLVNTAESTLFNIMFILSLETRRVLPMASTDYKKLSLTSTLWKIEPYNPEISEIRNAKELERTFSRGNGNSFKYTSEGYGLHDRMMRLINAIHKGAKKDDFGFEISGFRETIFNDSEWQIFKSCRIQNKDWVSILHTIGYTLSEAIGFRKYQLIPYEYFTPRQLGSIYESFLEFKLAKADEGMIFIKGKWQSANLDSEKVRKMDVLKVKKGKLFFTPNNAERKATGSYYTPDEVVQLIVSETLSPLVLKKKSSEILQLKVADTAMGSGHFLAGALLYLAKKYLETLKNEVYDDLNISLQEAKQEILHNCIYGADINSRAVKLAKMSLWLESASANRKLEHLDDQLKATNSLTDYNLWKKEWKFLDQGIDAVVGNPPYLGEKGHKEIFQEIANGWLGKRFYQGKMDLFYFFFHLGLDILKPNGRLGFITTNYYTTALGAKNLRFDLYERTNIDLLMNLNELKVFGEATGQHNMITIVTKTIEEGSTKIVNSSESGKCTSDLLKDIYFGTNKKTSYSNVLKKDLFDGEEKYVRIGSGSGGMKNNAVEGFNSILEKVKKADFLLGDICDINQGIVTGADKVSPKHIDKYKVKAKKGDGIFVLSGMEILALSLGKDEQSTLVKPFFKNSNIKKFITDVKSNDSIIYTDRNCSKISDKLDEHLKSYKAVLSERREVKNGVIKWFQLQWPREKSIFQGPKIVAPQRSKLNTFGYNEISWYAASDVFFVTSGEKPQLELKAILGILNSKLIYSWLYMRGKKKGETLELIAKPISEVPIKKIDSKLQEKIVKYVDVLIHGHDEHAWQQLNSLIYEIYGIASAEVKLIEEFYDEKANSGEEVESDAEEQDDAA